MKAALLAEYDRPLELIDRPVPEPQRPNEVLVKILGAGVCATDLHAIEGLMEPAGLKPPIVLGHENAGRVEATGDMVLTVQPGDDVLIYPPQSCGVCVPCRRAQDMHCERHEFVGLTVDGGFAEYVVVPERNLVKLPEGVDPVVSAPHADAGITAYHAVKRVAPQALPGSTAVVIGVGGVGHIAVQLLRELGSADVVAIDPQAERQSLATELGCDDAIGVEGAPDAVREMTDGRGADLVLDFVGSDQTHADGMAMLAKQGTYSMIGFGGIFSVPSVAMVSQEQTARTSLVGSWIDLWEVVQLHARGRITLKTETHPLDDVNEVLDRLREGDVMGRAVLLPDSDGAA
jgi:NAD+-dependent secondary alcohol dehydrogenase Adh1